MNEIRLDAHYTDPRLVALYDLLNTDEADIRFYARIAGDEPLRVLDIGCGTGQLSVEFASRGHIVTGLDPAAAMLEVARNRPRGEAVTWMQGTTADLPARAKFDFAVMTGHVFQVFLEDAEMREVLRDCHRLLAPGGRVAFETRNPLDHGWERWTEERTRMSLEHAGLAVDVHYQWTSAEGEFVEFDAVHHFPSTNETLVSHSRLRFVSRERLMELLVEAGFSGVDWYGGWDGRPYSPGSREIIVIAQRPD